MGILPGLIKSQREVWKTKLQTPPEKLDGLTLDQALVLLRELDNGQDLKALGERLGKHAVYEVLLKNGERAIVKYFFRRVPTLNPYGIGPRNNVQAEVLAFAVDRLIQSNLVSPTIFLRDEGIAELKIHGKAVVGEEFGRTPENFMEASLAALIDSILVNADHGKFAENLIEGVGTKHVTIDFDLSQLISNDEDAVKRSLTVYTDSLPTKLYFKVKVHVPGVYPASVIKHLREITAASLSQACSNLGLKIRADDLGALMRNIQMAIKVIDQWKIEYGPENIEIPGM